jgi:ABC-type lipoprotein export system ATPase subunit
MTDPPLLEVRKISKRYGLGGNVVTALHELDLTVQHGELLVIMGSSGSGKSTLLQILGTLDHPTEGTIWIEGRDFTHASEQQLTALRNKHFGFVFQSYNLLPELNALENVALPLVYANASRRECLKRAEHALNRVGLSHRRTHYPRQLSGGEQQRVAIARAVVHDPAVLFGDEPTGNLAGDGRDQILAYFEEFRNDGTTVVLVSHDLEVGARASRRVFLKDGRLDAVQTSLDAVHA